jgi:thioredoxin 1
MINAPSLTTPIEVTSANFDHLVSQNEKPVLLQFWASWCVPCMLMKRTVAKASESLVETVSVGLVNIDNEPELVAKFGVQGTPSFLVLQQGEVIETFVGMSTSAGIVKRVNAVISQNLRN